MNYLIKVKSINRIDEVDEDYFIYNQNGIKKISDDEGINIYNEYWTLAQTEGILLFTDLNAEKLFKYTLKVIESTKPPAMLGRIV